MEDLFDLLLTLAVVVFGVMAKRNKNKKKQAADKPVNTPEAAKPAAPEKPAVKKPANPAQVSFSEAFEALTELLEDRLPDPDKPAAVKVREQTAIEAETAKKTQSTKAGAKTAKAKVRPASGESIVDEHGCVGGSMPAHNPEGESKAEHAEHERNRTERLAAEAAIRAESLRKPSLTELRKAVVMAEILDKPVSLRRRRI